MPNENTTPQLEHQIRRPGYKSSEFIATAVAMFLGALPYILPLLDDSVKKAPEGSTWGLVGACIVAAGYALSRGNVKASRNMASAAASMPSTVAAGGNINVNPEPQSEAGTAVAEPEHDGPVDF